MFMKNDLEENGEVPSPYREEKYNFNIHDVTGDFNWDSNGNPILSRNDDGQLIDKHGRLVNEKGRYVDNDGHIVNKFKRKMLDKIQLEEGDIPSLLNYDGKKYWSNDIVGTFEKDPRGDIITIVDKNNNQIDMTGHLINKKGYLVDKKGNIVDR